MSSETVLVRIGECRDRVTAERALELIEEADPLEPVEVLDSAGRALRIEADLDLEALVLHRGEDILAIGDTVSTDVLDRWI